MLDPSRNGTGSTIVAPYSPRAREDATVSFPVVPDELRSLTPSDFTLSTAPRRLSGRGPKRWAEAAASDRHQRLPASLLRG
jgi:DNA primase